MPVSQFTKLTLLPGDAGLEVRGTYDPKISGSQRVVGDVFIGFLIIQMDGGNPTRIVDDVTRWEYAAPDPATGTYHEWSTIVDGAKVKNAGIVADKVRAIGTAVQNTIYADDPHVPPGVEYFTWCVDQTVDPAP